MPLDIDSLRHTLENGDPSQRLEALKEALRNRQDTRIIAILTAHLNQEDNAAVLSNLIKVLACAAGDQAFPHLIQFLVHEDDRVRANTVEALEMTGSDNIPVYLLATLNDPHPRVRLNSLKALQKYDMVDPLPLLNRMLESESSGERSGAAWVIAHIDNPQAAQRLLEAYRSERDPEVRLRMIASLEANPTPDILMVFGEALSSAEETEKAALRKALGRSYLYAHRMQREVVDGIFMTLRGLGESMFREAAANALDEKRSRDAVDEDLNSFNPAIRRGALIHLARLFPEEAQPVLERFLGDPDLDVARTADSLLKDMSRESEPPAAPTVFPGPEPAAEVSEPPAKPEPAAEAPETPAGLQAAPEGSQILMGRPQSLDLTSIEQKVDKFSENLEFLQRISGTEADQFNFKNLNEEQIKLMTRGFNTKVFPAGKFIYRDNEQVRFWYIIKRGTVELLSPENVSVSVLGPGKTLGEMPEPGQTIVYQNKARAMEEVELMLMDIEKLTSVQVELPDVLDTMRDISARRRASLARKILSSGTGRKEDKPEPVKTPPVPEESPAETAPAVVPEPEPDEGPADPADFPCFGEYIPDDDACLTCEVRIQCGEATTEPVEIDLESLEAFACFGQYEEGVESCQICTVKSACKNKAMDVSNDEYPCFGEFDDGDPGCLTCLVIDQCKQKKG